MTIFLLLFYLHDILSFFSSASKHSNIQNNDKKIHKRSIEFGQAILMDKIFIAVEALALCSIYIYIFFVYIYITMYIIFIYLYLLGSRLKGSR